MEENKEQKEFMFNDTTISYLNVDFVLMCMLMMLLATRGTSNVSTIDTPEIAEGKKKLRELMKQFLDSLDKADEQRIELQKLLDEKKEKGEEFTPEDARAFIESFEFNSKQ